MPLDFINPRDMMDTVLIASLIATALLPNFNIGKLGAVKTLVESVQEKSVELLAIFDEIAEMLEDGRLTRSEILRLKDLARGILAR